MIIELAFVDCSFNSEPVVCKLASIYKENKLFFKQNTSFTQKGIYKINIKHAVRQTGKIVGEKELKGVTEVGFRIESIEK